MSEPSEARVRAQQREADRQRARDERKAESDRRRARKGNDEDGGNPNDAMTAAGWDHKEYNQRKAKAASSASSSSSGGDGYGEQSQEDQIIAHATKLQNENSATLKNTIKVARETTVVGASTIHKLNEQTEQFQRMDNTLTETGDSISRSERILRGMKSFGGAITNMFTSGKPKQTVLPHGAGGVTNRANETNNLDELDRAREARRAVEQDRVKQMDFDGGSDARAATGSSSSKSSSSSSKGRTTSDSTREVIAPNSKQQQAINTFQTNQQAEDEALDELSDVLGTLKQQSQTMSSQLATQSHILDGIDAKVENTSARLQKGSRTMGKIS